VSPGGSSRTLEPLLHLTARPPDKSGGSAGFAGQ
jgi:hypothetical protein